MRKTVLLIIAVLTFASCVNYADKIHPEEIALKVDEVYVPCEGGVCSVQLLSNLSGEITPEDKGATWVEAAEGTFCGDATLQFNCAENTGFCRMTRWIVRSKESVFTDTLTIKQYGAKEVSLAFADVSQMIYNGTGATQIALACNLDSKDVEVSISYNELGASWIKNVQFADNALVLSTEDNPAEAHLRKAALTLRYVDGWNREYSTRILLTQLTKDNALGVKLSVDEVKAWAEESFDGDYYFEAVVTSCKENGNAGDNVQLTATTIDYSLSSRTVYLQNEEGTSGLALITDTAEDNVFGQWTKVMVSLNGCTIERFDDPARVIVKGIKASSLFESREISKEDITIRSVAMSELSDSDIFTYLTITDAEFAVRKGPLTPISENFTPVKGRNWITKFPLLVLGADGSSMYTLTNINCSYRRNGSRLPYGRGNLSGVIVHETYPRFSYEDAPDFNSYGNIGRYQIRTMSFDDIAMESDASDVLVEYNYAIIGVDRYIDPTQGTQSGFLYSNPNYTYSGKGTSVWYTQDFAYLGPVGNGPDGTLLTGNVTGCGLFDKNGTELLGPGVQGDKVNQTGLGTVSSTSDPFCAWAASYWIKENYFFAYQLYFSTKTLTAPSCLTAQISMLGTATNGYSSPRYWHVQYYIGTDAPANDSADWVTIPGSEFSVPDFCYLSLPKEYSSAGFKAVNINLPQELLGQDRVWLAVRPSRDVAASVTGYADGTIGCSTPSSRSANTSMNYIAIRVN